MTSGDLNRQWLAQAQKIALAQGLAQGQGLDIAQGQGLGAPGFSEAEMENARMVLEFLTDDDDKEEDGGGRGRGGEENEMEMMARMQSEYRYGPGPAPDQGTAQEQGPVRRSSGASIHSNNSSCRFLGSSVDDQHPNPLVDVSGSQIETSDSHSHSLTSHIGSRVTFGHSQVSVSGDDDDSGNGGSGNGNSGSGSGSNGSVRSLSWLLGMYQQCTFDLISFSTH